MWTNPDVFSLVLLVAIGSFCIGLFLGLTVGDRPWLGHLSILRLLPWRHRLAVMQTQLDDLSSAVRSLEAVREGSFVRSLNVPRPRKARKSSSPSSNTLEEKITSSKVPKQLDEENSKMFALPPLK